MKQNNFWQLIKFTLFSISAGIIQIGSFTVVYEFILKEDEKFYWYCYLPSLLLSVLWNFTFNRRFTFKSAANVPVAMLKVLGFYAVFTPVSLIIGEWATRQNVNDYIVLGLTMLANFLLEYLFCKFFVYKGKENTL